ncbi:MAG: tetratricopeptide repeat protein, partial [Bradymonadaceae bacterium]
MLETAADLSGDVAQPHYWRGRLAELEGNVDDALSHYDNGLGNQDDHVASRLRIAHLQYRDGELEKAFEQVDKILNKLGSASGDVETAEAYHVMGLVHSARSENTKAIEAFTKAIDKDSDRSQTLHKLAEAYEQAGKYQEALNFFQSNKALEKENPEVLLGIVRAYMGLEKWQDAINKLEEGEKRFPDDARFPYFLGKLHLERGAFSDARDAMERAVSLDSTLLEAYGTLAQLVWRLEKDPSAAEYYVQQIVNQPELIDATVARKVAGYYRMSNREELAIQWYKEALKRDPNDWPARLSLAKIYLSQERTV